MTSGDRRAKARARRHETPSGSLLVALGYTEDKTRYWRALGSALEALVRALTQRDVLAKGLGRRLFELWMNHKGVAFVFTATEVQIDGKAALVADRDRGRFVLPAYAAGLRSIRMLPDATPEALLRVVDSLAALVKGPQAISGFRQWLWSDAAEGFEVTLGPAFDEQIDSVLAYPDLPATFYAERSKQLVATWNEQALAAAHDLDAQTLRNEYRRPVERLQKLAHDPRLELSKEEVAALVWASDDESMWARVESETMLAYPELLDCISPDRLGVRVLAVVQGAPAVDAELIAYLRRLTGVDLDTPSPSRSLNSRRLGRALAARVSFERVEADDFADFLAELGRHARSGAATELLGRAVADPAAWRALGAMMRCWKMSGFVEAIDLRRVEPEAALRLYEAAEGAGVELSHLGELVAYLPADAALAVAAVHPEVKVAQPRRGTRSPP